MIHIQDGPLGLDDPNRRVFAGVWDTKNAASVQFDVSDWLAAWPGGTLHILVQRPGDEYPYPAQSVQISNGVAEWTFDAVDTAYAGVGSCALVYELGEDVRARTEPYDLLIAPTIGPADDDPPDPLQRWYDDIIAAADTAEAAAESAETAQAGAEAAETAAEAAQAAAESAAGAAETAEGAAEAAQAAAETAAGAAETAQGKAEDAQAAAETAESNAATSATAAGNAQTAAETAQGKAEAAQTAAEGAADDAAGSAAAAAASATSVDADELNRRILAAFPTDALENVAAASFPDGADNIPVLNMSFSIPYFSSGWSSLKYADAGESLLDGVTFTEGYFINDNGALAENSIFMYSSPIPVSGLAKIFYCYRRTGSSQSRIRIHEYSGTDIETDWLRQAVSESLVRNNITYGETAVSSDAAYVRISIPRAGDMLYLSPDGWGKTEDISGSPLYGGTFNPVTGALTYTLDSSGAPLPEPVVTQLTPLELKTFLGENNIFSPSGNVTVDYRADPTLYIQKKLEALS